MRIIVSVLACTLLLSSCSSRLAYNNLDWLIHWYVDDYVDFSSNQKYMFDQHFSTLMRWHRYEELGNYRKDLVQLKQVINSDAVDKEQIQNYVNMARDYAYQLRDKAAIQMIDITVTLSDQQVDDLFIALEKDNIKQEKKILKERANGDLAAIQLRIKNITDELKGEFGRLTKEQNGIIEQYAPRFNETGLLWLEYRRKMQSEAKALFATRLTNDNFKIELIELIQNPRLYRSAEYAEQREQNKQIFIELLTVLAPTTTAKQNRKANKRIDGLIKDIDILMAKQH